jgi:hypothetical protein
MMFMIAANFISSWPMMAENGYTGRAESAASTSGSATARVATRRRGLLLRERGGKKTAFGTSANVRDTRLQSASKSEEARRSVKGGTATIEEEGAPFDRDRDAEDDKKNRTSQGFFPTFRRSFGDPRLGGGGRTSRRSAR